MSTKIITVFMFLIIFFSGCLSSNDNEVFEGGITALEGKSIADEVAFEIIPNAYLTFVGRTGSHSEGGRSIGWRYKYSNDTVENISSQEEYQSQYVNVRVYDNYSYEIESFMRFYKESAIIIWTIDSDIAYNIAMNNSWIQLYLSNTDEKAYIDYFALRGWSEHFDNITTGVWTISWTHHQLFGVFNAKIEIDASTGEVLYVETPDT